MMMLQIEPFDNGRCWPCYVLRDKAELKGAGFQHIHILGDDVVIDHCIGTWDRNHAGEDCPALKVER